VKIDHLGDLSGKRIEEDLKEILRNNKLRSISILDEAGNVINTVSLDIPLDGDLLPDYDQPVYSDQPIPPLPPATDNAEPVGNSTPSEVESGEIRPVTIKRVEHPGSIRVTIGTEKLQEIKSRIGLQLLIFSLEKQNVIQYASFFNDQLMVIADYEPSRIGIIEEKLEYLDSLNTGVSYFLRKEDVMEVVHPLLLTQDSRGVFKVGFSLKGTETIYSNASKITIANSIVIMMLAIVAVVFMLRRHIKNIDSMELMEKKIRENEKLVSLGNLTAGVAHEVRNPLNSISITIQRLQLEFSPQKNEDLEEYVMLTAMMKKEVDRINAIITDLLDFSKPFKPENSVFPLNDFLNENVALFSGEAENKNVRIVRKINTNNTRFFGDREKLTQMLINLWRNALDATKKYGSITIHSNVTRNNKWQLKIEDDGEGISKDNLNHIFDIYFTTKRTGTGLGLYITRKIVQAHNGAIELIPNTGGRGITAIVTIPNPVPES
ncbi:MAG: hypothetical protein GY866_01515, partial [Proteobacteria bacterium]|nr:hypothetical protein [Pseudomonadota bacterium]